MPWGGAGFDFSTLTSDGLALLAKALEWAGQPDGGGGGTSAGAIVLWNEHP